MIITDDDKEYEDSLSTSQELKILYLIIMMGEICGETVVKEITDFVERIIPRYMRHIFKEHFR